MKRIYLMRHGKAEDGFDKSDFERDLQVKGRKKTTKIAKFLQSKRVNPRQILVSMANRTKETAAVVMDVLGLNQHVFTEEKSLYLASSNSMLDVLYAVDDNINELMLIGHNPGISSLATYLCNKDIDWMPTSSVVAVELNINKWNELADAKRKLLFYVKPSDI